MRRFFVDRSGLVRVDENVHVWNYERVSSSEGYSVVYCRSSVKQFSKLRNSSAWDLSRNSQIPSSTSVCRCWKGLCMLRRQCSRHLLLTKGHVTYSRVHVQCTLYRLQPY